MNYIWSCSAAPLLATLLLAPIASAKDAPPKNAPPTTQPLATKKDIADAIDRGVAFLLKTQNKDGSWGTGKETRGFEVYSMVPGSLNAFRVATTALCVMALRDVGEKEAHDRGVEYLIKSVDVPKRDDGALIYTVWAHTYAIQALALEIQATDKPDPRLKEAAEKHLVMLEKYQTYMGGWNYYDFNAQTRSPSLGPTSFGTAAGLVALYEAKQAGIKIPQKMVDLSLKRLAEMRLPTGTYLYSHDLKYNPRQPANQTRGSIGRNQACNYALWLWESGGIDEPKAREGLDVFFKEHIFIEIGRKRQFPHEAWYQTAPYYYYFGHYYAGRLIEKLSASNKADYGQRLAAEHILPKQDSDGSWWDFAMWDFHKPYGTAYAIMTLKRCE